MDIIKEIESLKISHYFCDDSWYSCPLAEGGCLDDDVQKGVCNCGAEKHNAKVDAIIEELRLLLDKQ